MLPLDVGSKANGIAQLLKGLLQDGARRGDVHAHEAFAAGAEHCAIVESQTGSTNEEVDETGVGKTEGAAVNSYEEGGLRPPRLQQGHLALAESADKLIVRLHIPQHLLPPLFALAEGGYRGDGGKESGLVQLVCL